MKKALTLLCYSLLIIVSAYSQPAINNKGTSGTNKKGYHVKWTTNPFDNQVFIENNGQFDGKIDFPEKVLYGVQLGAINIYFTAGKVVYRYDKNYFVKKDEPGEEADDLKNRRHEVYMMSTEWLGASNGVSIEAKNGQKSYYTYPSGSNKTIKADIFKKIIYKNLYPGIDAIYEFVQGKTGIKYSLIVHPGADISKIKISYSGTKNITRNSKGDLIISSDINEFTEHAPVSSYMGEESPIPFSNVITGNIESFKAVKGYDKLKTLVIDPWITDPLFTSSGWDKAYDLDWDYYGNVYAYGGEAIRLLQLVKMDKNGMIQWTFNATTISGECYGDFAVDKVTGTSYVAQGFSQGQVLKVNTLGSLTGTYPGSSHMNEIWRAEYDACNGKIIIAGGGTSDSNQAAVVDTNMTTLNPVDVMGVNTALHDCSLLTLDPDGTHAYIASAQSQAYPTMANNMIMQMPLPSLSPTLYRVHENCHFTEVLSVPYCGTGGGSYATNAMNGAATSPNWLYLYNGDTIRRYHKNTGAYVSCASIRTNSPFRYGGIGVDPCDNLFLGVDDSIFVMDSTYTMKAKIPLQDTVFDVQLGQNGALYACGRGYVTQVLEPISVRLISSAAGSPTSCSACNGTATVNVNCGISPYSFVWSNGSTNQTDTGLCAGIYTVTVTDGACPPHSDTAVVNISGKPGYGASVIDTNPNCLISLGNITVYPFGGTSPYTYSWNNSTSSTTQGITGLSAGTYICTISDADSCRYEVAVSLVNPVIPVITIRPNNDSLCNGDSVVLTASGVKTYTWTPNTGLSCYNCPSPTATPTVTTTYTINGVDSNGCTASKTITIKVYNTPKPIITGKDSICAGYSDTLTVTGGTRYVWSNSATSSSIIVAPASTKTITVTAYNGFCQHDTTLVIHVVSPAAAITASKDSTCSGDTVKLSGSGGNTFKWSNGSTTSTIIVSPAVQTTYTLYAGYGACDDSATITIGIIKSVTATVSALNDTVCPNEITTINANASGGASTYKWSNGATTSSISVSDTVNTTYSVTVYGKCDSIPLTKSVTVVALPKPVITGTVLKCKGVTDTLYVTGGTSYLWSNGKTTTTYITKGIDADSTIKVYAFNSLGCKDSTTFTIDLRIPPNVSISPPAVSCAGVDVLLKATATGAGPFTYTWAPGGATSDTVTVDPTTATTYTVTVTNGCKATKSTTVTPSSPSMSACCDKTIIMGDDTTIVAFGDSIKTYVWAPSVDCKNPPLCDSVKVTPTVTTTYTVIGTDSKGCQIQELVTISVETPCFNFTVPNVITPDEPGPLGLNAFFYIKTTNLDLWSIIIYDRWGKEMYNSSNPNEYWAGTTEEGAKAPDGVYYYIINATCQGNTYKRDGFLQLIR